MILNPSHQRTLRDRYSVSDGGHRILGRHRLGQVRAGAVRVGSRRRQLGILWWRQSRIRRPRGRRRPWSLGHRTKYGQTHRGHMITIPDGRLPFKPIIRWEKSAMWRSTRCQANGSDAIIRSHRGCQDAMAARSRPDRMRRDPLRPIEGAGHKVDVPLAGAGLRVAEQRRHLECD